MREYEDVEKSDGARKFVDIIQHRSKEKTGQCRAPQLCGRMEIFADTGRLPSRAQIDRCKHHLVYAPPSPKWVVMELFAQGRKQVEAVIDSRFVLVALAQVLPEREQDVVDLVTAAAASAQRSESDVQEAKQDALQSFRRWHVSGMPAGRG